MLTSLAFIFLVGLSMAAVCQRLKLPRIIGMLITGIVLGPYVLDLLDPSILFHFCRPATNGSDYHSAQGGASLNLADLKKVGRAQAMMMACVPQAVKYWRSFYLHRPFWVSAE